MQELHLDTGHHDLPELTVGGLEHVAQYAAFLQTEILVAGHHVAQLFLADLLVRRPIGLQNHSGANGPSTAEFRNVQIADL